MFMMWITNKQARPGTLIAAVPLFILWFLWNDINNSKHNGVRMKAIRIIKRTHYLVESLMKAGILIHAVRKRVTYLVVVTWMKPKDRWSKLNTDGALKGCGLAIGGRVIHNNLGDVTWGFYDFYGTCSILEAELKGVATGLQLCWQNDITKVWIEVDSAMLLCIHQNKGPWGIQYIMKSIHQSVNKWRLNFPIYGGKEIK
ncbi:RNase H domain-containing protein [Abeliophyllum distichum]|uniref:RNase H domain-containing protein n=1 Tax=Abeliophyllum distichum TaxID=126358 RepID=A0ABD1V5Z6_9LAMI